MSASWRPRQSRPRLSERNSSRRFRPAGPPGSGHRRLVRFGLGAAGAQSPQAVRRPPRWAFTEVPPHHAGHWRGFRPPLRHRRTWRETGDLALVPPSTGGTKLVKARHARASCHSDREFSGTIYRATDGHSRSSTPLTLANSRRPGRPRGAVPTSPRMGAGRRAVDRDSSELRFGAEVTSWRSVVGSSTVGTEKALPPGAVRFGRRRYRAATPPARRTGRPAGAEEAASSRSTAPPTLRHGPGARTVGPPTCSTGS